MQPCCSPRNVATTCEPPQSCHWYLLQFMQFLIIFTLSYDLFLLIACRTVIDGNTLFLCFVDRACQYNSGKWPTWRTILFSYMCISILYMFRATSCSSSGESIVSIQLLVCVTLCRWPSSMQVGNKELPDPHTKRSPTQWHTRRCIDTIDSPDDEHEVARNM
jgi:hypothetical protein